MHPLLSTLRLPTTPCLVVLEPVLAANLAALQDRCDRAGVRLRPHAKMHKSSAIAARQMALGAVGVCAQTPDEAEALIAGGCGDVLITAPPPPREAGRIAGLLARARLAVVVDDADLARALGAAAGAARPLAVIMDVDLGQHRSGVAPEDAPAFARFLAGVPGLRLAGVQGYFGHIQHLAARDAREEAAGAGARRLGELVRALREADLEPEVVTGGGTGTFSQDLRGGVFTELQAGSYAFMDAEYGACRGPDEEGGAGADAGWPFAPALHLAASVVSTRHLSLVTIDAGLKALSADGPPPRILGAESGSRYLGMGDEHGAVVHPAAAEALLGARGPLDFSARVSACDAALAASGAVQRRRVGDVVWLQPGHCDPTVNLHEAFYLADAEGRLTRVPIDARRRVPPA